MCSPMLQKVYFLLKRFCFYLHFVEDKGMNIINENRMYIINFTCEFPKFIVCRQVTPDSAQYFVRSLHRLAPDWIRIVLTRNALWKQFRPIDLGKRKICMISICTTICSTVEKAYHFKEHTAYTHPRHIVPCKGLV